MYKLYKKVKKNTRREKEMYLLETKRTSKTVQKDRSDSFADIYPVKERSHKDKKERDYQPDPQLQYSKVAENLHYRSIHDK